MTTTILSKKTLPKQKDFSFKKDVYLLGADADGTKYWLDAATWDCGWYWGFGYVETYAGNHLPSKARDIDSHQHIDSSFMGKIGAKNEYITNIFDCPLLVSTTFTVDEGWTLSELLKSFYTLKATAEFYHTGGAHISTNPLKNILSNKAEEDRINKDLLPKIFDEIYKILAP